MRNTFEADTTASTPAGTRAGVLRDQLGNANITRVSTGAFAVINALQNHSTEEDGTPLPGELLGSITAAFILAMECSRLPSGDVCSITRNIMADAEGRRAEFKAITRYIEEEVFSK